MANTFLKPKVAVVGCGRLGKALVRFLGEAGCQVTGVAGNNLETIRKFAQEARISQFSDQPWEVTGKVDLVFITTPDGSIKSVCEHISQNRGFKAKSVVVHCSGAHPSTILSSAQTCGTWTASMHPLQSFADVQFTTNPFNDIVISIEGDSQALPLVSKIAAGLGGKIINVKTEAKVLYHAAAVTASNYLVTLMDLSFRLLETAGIEPEEAMEVLYPLVQGTLNNIKNNGIAAALTGPIARGDAGTIARHLQQIQRQKPELLQIYKALGVQTIKIAASRGELTQVALVALEQAINLKEV